ncbi:MAG: PEP-CTERM sorting domain-containing protein [Planctomycetota bacterium]
MNVFGFHSVNTALLCGLAVGALAFPASAQTIAAGDSRLVGFANSVADYSPATGVGAGLDDPLQALGAPNVGDTGAPNFLPLGLVSLGDAPVGTPAGSITLGFSNAITNGAGDDFAVFENAFLGFSDPAFIFAELAFVEVSTDGNTFARFFNTSATTIADPSNPLPTDLDDTFGRDFALLRQTNVSGFAGADVSNTGTLFDLQALVNETAVINGDVDLNEINFVRLIDIPGDGRSLDSNGNPIFDSFDPGATNGGFDLDAVGVLNQVPEPGSAALLLVLAGLASRRRGAR